MLKVQDIIWLFQEDPIVKTKYPQDETSQYIVGTTKLIEVGYTMIKAKRLVQLDSEWMIRNEIQVRKRINRVSQTQSTHTYALIFEESDVEKIMQDRQTRRAYLIDLALDSINMQMNTITREAEDDESIIFRLWKWEKGFISVVLLAFWTAIFYFCPILLLVLAPSAGWLISSVERAGRLEIFAQRV